MRIGIRNGNGPVTYTSPQARPAEQPPQYDDFPEPAPAPQPHPVAPDNWYGPLTASGLPLVSGDPVVQDRYEYSRRQGESHNMAEILATRQFPGAVTDATFMRGRHNQSGLEGMAPDARQFYLQQAADAGVHTGGKHYAASMARFPGDPSAWVDSRADVVRLAHQNNMTVESPTINVGAPRYYDPGAPVEVAPDIVDKEIMQRVWADPRLAAHVPDLRQDIVRQLRGGSELPELSDADLREIGTNRRDMDLALAGLKANIQTGGPVSGMRAIEAEGGVGAMSVPAGLLGLPTSDGVDGD